jgi:hypothetical protein
MNTTQVYEWRDPVQLYLLRKARRFRVIVSVLALILILAVYWFVFRA